MKDCLILGTKTSCQYQHIFPLIKERKLYIGITNPSTFLDKDGNEVPIITNWYNTLGVHKHKALNLSKTYNPEDYPTYDNYPYAINVDKLKDIPVDYDGVMGVPVSFLDGYYDGFEIVGVNNDSRTDDFKYLIKGTPISDVRGVPRFGFFVNGKLKYTRILIIRKRL